MARLIYLLDTNAISDLIEQKPTVIEHVRKRQEDVMCLCAPVHYEIRRGLLYRGAVAKTLAYEKYVRSQFQWVRLEDEDIEQAAVFYAETKLKGRQLADMDLLTAAIALRLDAIVVTADNDFDVLPVKRENWRM